MKNEFTGVFFKDGDWWVAYAEELPGANTQGETLDEAAFLALIMRSS